MSQAIAQLMKKIGYSELVLVGPYARNPEIRPLITPLQRLLLTMEITAKATIEIDEFNWNSVYYTNTRIRTPTKGSPHLNVVLYFV